jgi:hypothetical protein
MLHVLSMTEFSSLFKECKLKRQYTFFPGETERTMTKVVKLETVEGGGSGLDSVQVLEECTKVILTQPQSGVAKLFMSTGLMNN